MSKQPTLADLQASIKTLINAVEDLKREQMLSTAQVSELYQLNTDLNLKFDTLDRNTMPEAAAKKTAAKKTAAKEVKRVPIKKGAKSADEPEDDDAQSTKSEKPESDTESEGLKVVKPAKVVKKEQRAINKLEYFKLKFTENNAVFDNLLTPAQKKEALTHKNKSSDEKMKIWYEYVKDNPELQTLKNDYIKEQSTSKIEIANKEDHSD